MQHKSNLDFSSGLTILPGLSFKSDAMIAAVCFCQDKPEQIAVFYEPVCSFCSSISIDIFLIRLNRFTRQVMVQFTMSENLKMPCGYSLVKHLFVVVRHHQFMSSLDV